MDAWREIELKLVFAAGDHDRLLAVEALASGTVSTEDLSARYYDTPAHDLDKEGFSLRVRTEGGRHVQTVKAAQGATAGLFVRPEWETELPDATPRIDRRTGPLPAFFGPDRIATLRPAFETDVRRVKQLIARGDSLIEVSIDTGAVRAGGHRDPVCEVELELKEGEAQPLFDLARGLNEAVPLRLGVLTKSERGYRLLGGGNEQAVRTEPIRLDPDADARAAFATIAGACIRHFRLNEDLLAGTGGAKPLHQARVALRRLRSACSLFKPLIAGDPRTDLLRAELRWLAAELGVVRNIDVLVARADDGLRPRLQRERDRAYAHAADELASARTRRLMIDLTEWLAIGGWRTAPTDPARETITTFAADLLDKHRRRIKRRGKGLADLGDEQRHAVRIEAKTLRYATEFFASLYPARKERKRHKAFLDAIEDLQEHLGELNDRVTAPQVLAELGIDPAPPPANYATERAALLAKAEAAHDALTDARRFWR